MKINEVYGDDWAKILAKKNRDRIALEKRIAKERKDLEKVRPVRVAKPIKPSQDLIWRKVVDVIGNSFPDGDPIDYLIPYMEKNGITMKEINAAVRKYERVDFYQYLSRLWDESAADQIHDAKNGHIDDNSPFYNVDKNQNIVPAQNPWKPTR